MEYHIKSDEDIKVFICDWHMIINDRNIAKELGEAVYVSIGDYWIVSEKGFMCYNEETVKYLYIYPKWRKQGFGNYLVNLLPAQSFNTVATKLSLNIFLRNGFTIIKPYTNYFKLTR